MDLVDSEVPVPDRHMKYGKLVVGSELAQSTIDYRDQMRIQVGKHG